MNKLLKAMLCASLLITLGGCKKVEPPKEEIKQEQKQEEEKTNQTEEKKETEQKKEETVVEEPKKEEEKKEETKQEEVKTPSKQEVTPQKPIEEKREEVKPSQPVTPAPSQPTKPTPEPTTGKSLASRGRIVVIDAGHGGPDPGCSNGNYLEKNITLNYALNVGQILQSQGIQVIYTRTNDNILKQDSYRMQDGSVVTNDLRARAELGEGYNAALYVSIHVDSVSSYAKGYSIYAHTGHPDSMALANSINAQLAALNYTTSKGVLNGSALRVIRLNTTISCLIELGFITGDLDILLNPSEQARISQAIASGIINKLNSGWIEPNLVLEKQPDLY